MKWSKSIPGIILFPIEIWKYLILNYSDFRLAEIEHQISSAASANSCSAAQLGFISSNSSMASVEDNERNKESIIWFLYQQQQQSINK